MTMSKKENRNLSIMIVSNVICIKYHIEFDNIRMPFEGNK